jgi:hypothetical protein
VGQGSPVRADTESAFRVLWGTTSWKYPKDPKDPK